MKYLNVYDILAIHYGIIEATGGSHGVREVGLLASVAERPRMRFGGKDLYPSIFGKAAVYFESLARHHVFIDGNKRTAFAVAVRFLFLNNYEFSASNSEVEKFVLKAVVDKLDLKEIAKWLKKNSKKVK